MYYTHYKNAQDAAWLTLLETGIKTLPVNLWNIAKFYGLQVVTYSDTKFLANLERSLFLITPETLTREP